MQSQSVSGQSCGFCLPELEKKARRLAASTQDTVAAGNAVVLYTMLLLEGILTCLAADPITNLDTILEVASRIAVLNSSIQLDP